MPSLQNLPDELLLNVINKLSVYDAMALSKQSRGIHALCDVKNLQKYHQSKFGREKYPQTHEAVLQAGLDTLLAILRTPCLGDYLRRVDLYGTGMIEFCASPEEIDRLKQAILGAGFQDAQERESILSMLSRNPAKFQSDSSTEALQFKDAFITLLVAAAPNLEFISMHPLLEYIRSSSAGNYERVNLLQRLCCRASASADFHPDDKLNESNEYVEDPYYHRLNMVRKLPAVESLVTWSNEAGIPPPPRSVNYSKISFTHSVMEIWDLCRIIKSAKALKSFISTIGGRLYPEGGNPVLCATPIFVPLDASPDSRRFESGSREPDTSARLGYQSRQEDRMTEEDRKDYEEQWADELLELAAPEIAPLRVSLKDFPQLKNITRGAGDGKKQLDSKSFNLVDHIPSTLKSLRIYGHGQPADTPYLDYESDLDVNAQIEQLARLKIFEGVDPCIPNGRTVDEGADEDDLELFWKDPDDNRFDDNVNLESMLSV
ncbi:uncharacterized protein N7446_009942 [Penicillium canescens]|uniref:F-box domain-containing protein n=1 Tax=Penicillium canescens TaxID=5083 RepID=A0AAD6N6L5_PENCN|nr:uncharacterized protein N7446_009942 [Penicillium canescens]KAJ6035183.1 hypothetical protein N7460_009358 [Penicillium canescens]KAJ6046841.1 hypothetical protein N7444_008095 [Penicillium canescens]KAJ6053930.1 hypothetical protein N7446_009942 [Penicillium canescens]